MSINEGTVMTSIPAVRRFNRFYTRLIGTLNENLLESSLSLAEARVLYELAHRSQPTASEIAAELGMDMSYLSRILSGFTAAKLIRRQISDSDRRQSTITGAWCTGQAGRTPSETKTYRPGTSAPHHRGADAAQTPWYSPSGQRPRYR